MNRSLNNVLRFNRPQSGSFLPEASHSAPTLSVDQVTIRYADHTAIQNACFDIKPGELMALVGPSGCGKSSLLNSINRMTDLIPGCQVSGSIKINQQNILTPKTNLTALRRRVGMVFQQPNPFPLSIAENIHFPLREHGVRNKALLREKTEEALTSVGLWEEIKDRLNTSAMALSGGQQQRLCFARTLALSPEILLLDEPCSALDPIAAEIVENLIVSLKQRYTMLMVTHNLAQAKRVADTVSVCWVQQGCGCVVESGRSQVIFESPKHPITAAYCRGEAG